MPAWKNIPLEIDRNGNVNLQNFGIELNRRLAYYLANIDVAQTTLSLTTIPGTLALSKGGTGQNLSAPAADSIIFYDLSGVAVGWLDVSTGLAITGTNLTIKEQYNDLQFQISAGRVAVANAPTWEAFTANTFEYSFAVNDYIDLFANEIPHNWKVGTNVDIHLHVTTKAANSTGSSRYAKFTVWVAYCDVNETWQETSFTAELEIVNGTPALKMYVLDMGDLTFTNYIIGAEIKVRVKRIAATGGTEYSGNIFINQVGAHYLCDSLGSNTDFAK